MNGYVKTDDIFKDMFGIIEFSQKAAYQAVSTTLVRRNWLLGYRYCKILSIYLSCYKIGGP